MSLFGVESSTSLGYGSDGSQENLYHLETENSVPVEERIFVNRNLNMGKIACYGFDMDYTVCEYLSPEFDKMAFGLAKDFLVDQLQYSEEVRNMEYRPNFPSRGLWYDQKLGNLLKVDQFGKILLCCHGFRYVSGKELKDMYQEKIQRKDDERIYVMNTLFNLPETHLIASLVDYMDSRTDAGQTIKGWTVVTGQKEITFHQLFQDVRAAIEHLHEQKSLKVETITNPEKYIRRDTRLPEMLNRLKRGGKKTFLLTNSDWWYTDHIMKFVFNTKHSQVSWMSYFDLVVVDGRKPKFFEQDNPPPLLRVNTITSQIVGLDSNPPGPVVYSGGNQDAVTNLLGVTGSQVLYCGDHLHADVVRCRKRCEWRTLLIVPELDHEIRANGEKWELLAELHRLERLLSDTGSDTEVRDCVWECIKSYDRRFGHTGSLFRSGSRLTYFGSHMVMWSDLYTGGVCNLASYSLTHRFLPAPASLPHERRHQHQTDVNSKVRTPSFYAEATSSADN